ncbi:MAG: PQQ-dependent sugar dehydrogenase [Myxococcales bacterium]|nr:PQQ-dependent sugar dehydrogenase [Myxococcales bacterium]
MKPRQAILLGALVASAALAVSVSGPPFACAGDPAVTAPGAVSAAPVFDGLDAQRRRINIRLERVASGFKQPTDIQPMPGQPGVLVVLEKSGAAHLLDLANGKIGRWFEVEVLTRSEQGLLGLAFHPKFTENGRFFINTVVSRDGEAVTRLAEWNAAPGAPRAPPVARRVLLDVPQPYGNHNAGQLAFGPDGMLYMGLGDGGSAGDPEGNGQNPGTLLGAMLRLDIDAPSELYGVPKDNPFIDRADARPEIFAFGLRNPWRFSFAPDGRLVVADVGQNLWEEITIVGRGENHGWNAREAAHCFPADRACKAAGLVDPIYEYPRADGSSITGGFVYGGDAVPALRGRYVFADFVSGRLWAIELPTDGKRVAGDAALALGRWPINPSTFGVDHRGELYVADFTEGAIHRLVGG